MGATRQKTRRIKKSTINKGGKVEMVVIKRSEINRMKKNIIDTETEMTELDYFEWTHSNEDWQIIEDIKGAN